MNQDNTLDKDSNLSDFNYPPKDSSDLSIWKL